MVYVGKFKVLAPVLTLSLLLGVAVEWNAFHLPPENLESYHGTVREAIERMPRQIGDWVGSDNEVDSSAIRLLRPNIILSRNYVNYRTGRKVSLLLVHCRDARDLRGHYPPVCYKAHGWTPLGPEPRDWTVDGTPIGGMQYKFNTREIAATNQIMIYHFMVRPGGGIERDMRGLSRAAEDRRLRALGGAQFQVAFDEIIPRDERDRIFEELLAPFLGTLDLIASGVGDE